MIKVLKKLLQIGILTLVFFAGASLLHAECVSGGGLCVYQTAPPEIQYGQKDTNVILHIAVANLTTAKTLKIELTNDTFDTYTTTKTITGSDVSHAATILAVPVGNYSIQFYDGALQITSTVPHLVIPKAPALTISQDQPPTFTDTAVTLSLKTNIGSLSQRKIIIEGDDISGASAAVQSSVITVPASAGGVTFPATLSGLVKNTQYKVRVIDSVTHLDIASTVPDFITGGLDLSNTHWYFTVYYIDGTHVDWGAYATEEICQAARTPEVFKNATIYGVTTGECYPNVTTDQYVQLPTDPNPAVFDSSCVKGEYCLLEPLPFGPNGKILGSIDTQNPESYINTILTLVLALAGALAVVMIVIGGVKYMGAESAFAKGAGRSEVTNAVLGLLLLLGAYAILNTINPNLVNLHIGLRTVTIVLSENGVKPDAPAIQSQPGYQNSFKMTGTFNAPSSSNALVDLVNQKLKNGKKLSKIQAYTGNDRICFFTDDGSSACVSMNHGEGGVANDAAHIGTHQTPKGTYALTSDIRRSTSTNTPVFTQTINPPTNLGASFWMLNINGGNSGIGIHGNFSNTLDETYGCLRMYNDDLVLLQPYVYSGLPVVIY